MAIFGPDISSYEAGLDLSRLAAASFVIAKTTEGTFYTDAYYQGWRTQCSRIGKPFAWYHFLSGESATAQAAHTKANVGDLTLPGMLDFEPTNTFNPTMAQAIAYVDAARAAGLRLRLVYLPRWYWQQLGSPSLKPFVDRGLLLVSSSYPGGSSSPASLYPGDRAAGWQGYGGMTPALYQFTNQASDGGQAMDYNAFRGTVAEFRQLLEGADDMQLSDPIVIPPAAVAAFPDYGFNNPTIDVQAALGWTAARTSHIANHLHEPVDAINAARSDLGAKLDQLLARPVVQPVDLAALEAFIVEHQTAGTSAADLAAALVDRLQITVSAK